MRDLREKRALITGASSGIGQALAIQLAKLGVKVALAARSAEPLHALAESLNQQNYQAVALPADITIPEQRSALLQRLEQHWGGLDLLINNAGVAGFGHFTSSNEALLRQVMEVNFFSPAELMRSAVPLLQEGKQPAIVNVASMCGRRGMPAWSEYSASKAALCGLTEALRGEFARFDIDVLLIVPGLTASSFDKHLLRNEGRMQIKFAEGMAPDEVAAGIVRALQKNSREVVLGREAHWMLRLNKFFPRLVDRLVARKVRKLYAEPTLPQS